MQRLKQEVAICTEEIESRRTQLQQAMRQSVNTDSLSTDVFGQILVQMQLKVRSVCESPCWIPKSKRIKGSEWLEDEAPQNIPITRLQNAHNSIYSNIMKSRVYRQTLKDQEGNSIAGHSIMQQTMD